MKCGVLLVLALVACGDNLPDPTQLRSGSRLKLAWYEYDGGARELETGWYFDRVLDQRCTSTPWGDGLRYCAPPTDEAVYVTETCTRALGRTVTGAAPAPFFATTFKLARASLPVPSRLFRRGTATLPPAAIWQKGSDGCIPTDLGGRDFEYFELGTEVSVTDLVRLHRSEPYGPGELAVINETSDDELQAPVALYDRGAGVECATTDVPNAISTSCMPVTTARATAYFLDAECTRLVAAVPAGAKPPLVSLHDARTSCTMYHRVGRGLSLPSPQLLFRASGPTCELAAWPDGQQFFELAERVYESTLGRVREPRLERIRAITRVSATLQLPDPLMYDADLETECQHDGEMQCAPRTTAVAAPATQPEYYVDPQCLIPIGLALVPRGACDPPSRFASDGAEYYELGEPYTNPVYVRSTGQTCSSFAPPEPYVIYKVETPVARSAFARAKLVIDP